MRASSSFALVCLFPALALTQSPQRPMPTEYEETTTYRWLQKPVHESRLLDDMENPSTWAFEGTGQMSFTAETGKGR